MLILYLNQSLSRLSKFYLTFILFSESQSQKTEAKSESKTETQWEANNAGRDRKNREKRHADEAMENEDGCYEEDDK